LQIYSARLDPHRALYHPATQCLDTHRCPSHCYQLRRGTPLTRSWFMPALNTQRFATVLTHPLTCFSHAEYHYCVTVYQSDVKSVLQSVCNGNLKFTGFTFSSEIIFKITHTSIDMHSSCRIPLLCDCLSIDLMCNLSYKVFTTLTFTGLIFSPNSFAFIKFNYTDLKIRLFIMMHA